VSFLISIIYCIEDNKLKEHILQKSGVLEARCYSPALLFNLLRNLMPPPPLNSGFLPCGPPALKVRVHVPWPPSPPPMRKIAIIDIHESPIALLAKTCHKRGKINLKKGGSARPTGAVLELGR
jgi:hypothetical protein